MLETKSYAAKSSTTPLAPFTFSRREVGPNDVHIEIAYCGVCHSDIHQARNEWGSSTYPMVPGHEIVGKVVNVGSHVKRFKVGDTAGVGCFVDSCRDCSSCHDHEEQFCENHTSFTYSGTEQDRTTPTYGGYSSQIVVDENYVLNIAPNLPLERVAPLLCAGITTYSPLRQWKVGKGTKVGVMGLGGLGHMAVKLAASMGAEVTMLSTSLSKQDDAKRLGAHQFMHTRDASAFQKYAKYFDFIINTISAEHDVSAYLSLLNRGGVMTLVGVPEKPIDLASFALIDRRRILSGSLIGGIRETQEMLDYCAEHNVLADVEVIAAEKINEAYERMGKSDVRYRFVIDMRTL